MAKVAVVILSWNGKKFLEQFVPGVVKSLDSNARLVVVDNASTDDTVTWLQQNFPEVQVIAHQKNIGFAGGYNEAIKKLDEEFIVLLNQDVEVTNNWWQPMLQLAEADITIGAIQPKIKWQLNKDFFEYAGAAGGWIDKYGYPFCRGRIFDQLEKDDHQFDDVKKIFWASGACMFVRRSVYLNCGGLDDDFFAHMEEIDLCWRIHRAGFQIMYLPQSTVYHVGGGSLPQGNPLKTYLNFRNSLVLLMKNLEPNKLISTLFIRLILDTVALMKSLFSGDIKSANAIFKAMFDFLKRYKYWKSKRKTELPFIPMKNIAGVYSRSVVWQYFLRRKKYFNQLFKP